MMRSKGTAFLWCSPASLLPTETRLVPSGPERHAIARFAPCGTFQGTLARSADTPPKASYQIVPPEFTLQRKKGRSCSWSAVRMVAIVRRAEPAGLRAKRCGASALMGVPEARLSDCEAELMWNDGTLRCILTVRHVIAVSAPLIARTRP